MSEARSGIRCRFTLANPSAESALHVGSVLNLSLDIPEEYAGDSVGSVRCRGHVVSVREGDLPGQVQVVCEIDQLECEPPQLGVLHAFADEVGEVQFAASEDPLLPH